jgi:hypothetical protein
MTDPAYETVLNRAQLALMGMQIKEIEAAEEQFAAYAGRLQTSNRTQLQHLHALALQSAQLWHSLLPRATSAVSYSPEGSVNVLTCGTELSVVG